YGAGATFTNIDAPRWQVTYNNGAQHETITFMNGAPIDPTDFVFHVIAACAAWPIAGLPHINQPAQTPANRPRPPASASAIADVGCVRQTPLDHGSSARAPIPIAGRLRVM